MPLCKIFLVLSIALFLASLSNRWLWVGELLVSFSLQHILTTLVLLTIFTLAYQFQWATMCAAFYLLQTLYLLSSIPAHSQNNLGRNSEQIRLLQFNTYCRNKQLDDIYHYLKGNFDIVVLQEVTRELRQKLLQLKATYPYNACSQDDKHYGIMILSKIPLTQSSTHALNSKTFCLSAQAKIPSGKSIAIFALHTTSPKKQKRWHQRNRQLQATTKLIQRSPCENKIVVGDFNTTPYSHSFKNLLENTGLSKTHIKTILQTWPSFLPVSFLRIPIDHVLTSSTVHVLQRKQGPHLGSDHFPIITYLALG